VKEKESVYVILSEIARHVLLGSLKPKPGVKVESVIENIMIHKNNKIEIYKKAQI